MKKSAGPLRRLVIPYWHSRRSRCPHFRKMLKCTSATIEFDFSRILEAFDVAKSADEVMDLIPLDILALTW